MNKTDLGLYAEGKTKEGHQDLGKNYASRLILKFYIDTNNELRSQIRFLSNLHISQDQMQVALESVYMYIYMLISKGCDYTGV
jgi:hypothetical protein